MVMPGDNVTMTVELIAPIAIEEGTRFAIREGGRTVGAGVVSQKLTNKSDRSPSPWVLFLHRGLLCAMGNSEMLLASCWIFPI